MMLDSKLPLVFFASFIVYAAHGQAGPLQSVGPAKQSIAGSNGSPGAVTLAPAIRPRLPAEITVNDGKQYKGVVLQRVEPDGLVVKYRPEGGGLGTAKLKFANLPES